MGELDGQVAIVTGGARGQGRSHAVTLAEAGADIVVCDIAAQIDSVAYPLAADEDLAETVRLVGKTGRRCIAVTADVRSREQVDAVAERAISEFGRIDILLANAGIASNATVARMPEQMWQDMIDVNLTGTFHSIRAVLPHMLERGYGRIVATASIAGRMGLPRSAHYAAAKWGVLGLVKSVAGEMGGNGITANAVLPAGVQTPMVMNPAMYRELLPQIENPTHEQAMEMFEAGGGLIQPEEISKMIMLLVTDTGARFNGETFTVTSGLSANLP
ncbi:MAG: mycofactocin-coupled SDR family oxidoreductase [Nocardia sp.]|nr:mycofactocin-coupled SDR family oxidoreductase [Nocardia sp.]